MPFLAVKPIKVLLSAETVTTETSAAIGRFSFMPHISVEPIEMLEVVYLSR
jgi:hypothetical protein